MKIVACVRTLNEESNIERFCKCYEWADSILISDGGSSDKTLEIAREFSNTKIHHFKDRVWHTNNIFSNPRGKHINYLIDWAHRELADWIIFDDCDCVPSLDLHRDAKGIMESSPAQMLFAFRMFIMGSDLWFPEMCRHGQGLWAWRSAVPVKADEGSYTISMIIPDAKTDRLEMPYSLLHYFYPNEETFQKKKAQYIHTGEVSEEFNPKVQFGHTEPLPDWARWA